MANRLPTGVMSLRSSLMIRRQTGCRRFIGRKIDRPNRYRQYAAVVSLSGIPQVAGDRGRVTFDAADAASYLVRAEYSVNGGIGSPSMRTTVSLTAEGTNTIEMPWVLPANTPFTIRVYDVSGNSECTGDAEK